MARQRVWEFRATEGLESRMLLTNPGVDSFVFSGTPATTTPSWILTFSEPVSGVDATDFAPVTKGTVTSVVSQVNPLSSTSYEVTIGSLMGTGTIALKLVNDGSIVNAGGNPLKIVNFQSQSTIVAGTNPTSVKLGDLNNDGLEDAVVTSVGTNSVSVFLGNGDGTFRAPKTFATGLGPWSVTIGDINHDGISDLAVTNFYSNTVSVLRGNGDGTFQTQQTLNTGVSPVSVLMSDVDGNGNLDLVTADMNSYAINVFMGNGDGSFQSQQSYDVGASPSFVTAGELNGDGVLDLVVTNRDSDTVSVLLGNGDGTFQYQQVSDAGYGPNSVGIADFNGDGTPDLAVSNGTPSGFISILLGDGSGGFVSSSLIYTGANPTSIIASDLNGDGVPDLTVSAIGDAYDAPGVLCVLLGAGDASFQAPKTFATGASPYSIDQGDINGDGQPDFAVANFQDSTLGILLGNGKDGYVGPVYSVTVDDPPVLTGSSAVIFKEAQVAVVINSKLVVSDVDNASLVSATVQITENYSPGEDILSFTGTAATGNIVGTFDVFSGILTLSSVGGAATLAQFQAALRLVAYGNASSNPSTKVRAVNFQLFDGELKSVPLTSVITIVPTNAAPVLAGVDPLVSISYAERQSPKVISPAITVDDVDNSSLVSATVKVSVNYAAGQDILGFVGNVNTGNITGSFNAAVGVLTLTSTGGLASDSQFQAALRLVTYANLNSNPSLLPRSVTYQVSDGALLSNTVVSTINVTAADEAPSLSGTSASIFKQNQAPVVINSAVVVADPDNASLVSATVKISSNYLSTQDVLAFTGTVLTGDLVGSFSSSTGVLSLTSPGGAATLAQVQAALRLVTYKNTSPNPSTKARSVEFQVNDGTLTSNKVTSLVTVALSNTAPIIDGVALLAYTENQAATAIDPVITVSDSDSSTLAFATVKFTSGYLGTEDVLGFVGNASTGNIVGSFNSSSGILTLVSPGATATVAQFQAALQLVAYTDTGSAPSPLSRFVTYQVSDGIALSNTVVSVVTVASVNDAPTLAGTGTLVATPQVAAAISPSIVVGDVDSSTLTSATVKISLNYSPSEDVLGFAGTAATGDIVGSFDPTSGKLTLTSAAATVAQFQAALQSVTYTATSASPSKLPRVVTYQISDGPLSSNVLSSVVSIKTTGAVPTLSGTSTISFTEGQSAIPISPALIVSDSDSPTLVWATIKLASYSAAQDALSFVPDTSTGNITGEFNSASGTLTLISPGGTATIAQFQAALRRVSYMSIGQNPSTISRNVSYVVCDGTNLSKSVSTVLNVTPVDNAPVISGSNAIIVVANQASATVNSKIILADLDSATLAWATVQITGNLSSAQDSLGFIGSTATGDIVRSYDSATGLLTLTSAGGSATVSQFQSALRLVTYTNSSSNPSTNARTIDFQVSDGLLNSNLIRCLVTVVPTTVAAQLVIPTFTPSYTEHQAPVAISPSITIAADTATLVSAKVVVSANYSSSQDVLRFIGNSTTGNITSDFNIATGTLTLLSPGGTATVGQFEAALRLVCFSNIGNTPSTLTRSISFQVSDGNVVSNTPITTLSVVAADDAPSLSGLSAMIYKEAQVATALATNITVADLDNTTLASATVKISSNFSVGEDFLAFTGTTATGNIVGSFNSKSGVLTLTSAGSTATLAQFQAALRLVTYASTSANPSIKVRSVDYQVSDGTLTSSKLTSLISIVSADNASVLVGVNTLAYSENQAATAICPAITVTDVDNAALISATVKISANFGITEDVLGFVGNASTGNIVGSYNQSSGTLTLISHDGTATVAQFQAALQLVTYLNTSDNPSTLPRSIAYQISDGTLLSNTVVSTVTVAAVNDAPALMGVGALIYTPKQAAAAINPGVMVTDADNTTLSFATVRICTNYSATQDVLGFVGTTATGNILGVFDAVTGTMTLSSLGATATVAQFQTALRLVTYLNVSATPSTTPRSVAYQISDSRIAGNIATSIVTIKSSGVAPTIGGVGSVFYAERQPATAISPALTVSDSDNATLVFATVKIASNYVSSQDVLQFIGDATTGNIKGSFNSSTGILTLISDGGTATVAQFQSALRMVSYLNTSANASNKQRKISYQVSDGTNLSATVSGFVNYF